MWLLHRMPPGTGRGIRASREVRLELLVGRASQPLRWFPTPDVYGVLVLWHWSCEWFSLPVVAHGVKT